MIHLAANENPLGMPASARLAAAHALHHAGLYPDGEGVALKQALSARLDVPPDWLVLGSGSRETQIYSSRSANPALGGLLRWFFCKYSRYLLQQRSCSAD